MFPVKSSVEKNFDYWYTKTHLITLRKRPIRKGDGKPRYIWVQMKGKER